MSRDASLSLARFVAVMLPTLLLGGALLSQHVGGLFPCEMCMWQRWPHLGAIIAALAAIALRRTPPMSAMFTMLAALAIATSGAIGAFHAGVEYGWWQGLTSCTATMDTSSGQSMLDSIMSATLVRCDVAPWSMFGISLAGYNAILSLGGALLILILVLKWSRS
ncbi:MULTISPECIES: disulfide bond formation protein B [unclassified Sphingobium]|uniref:disulfide bond formation protein B n=1 Tax=unclassified Sphingobium TaxID=2611147 RepID=UPI002224856A|nr:MULTISPECIES: disulfide bond formation protein B [unclassified Sphingobium]MCW2412966.1 disulfide bond formation protein DsbB [Sphingobium sp. B8D3D]MCW2414734.1 disulfide bond formation protein DsbB [Sphingobium sp. B8D3A]